MGYITGGVTGAMFPSISYIPLFTVSVKGVIKGQCPLDIIYPRYFTLLPPLPPPDKILKTPLLAGETLRNMRLRVLDIDRSFIQTSAHTFILILKP